MVQNSNDRKEGDAGTKIEVGTKSEIGAKKGNNVIGIVIIALLVVLIAVGGVIAAVLLNKDDRPVVIERSSVVPRDTLDVKGTVATLDNYEEVFKPTEIPIEDRYFTASQNAVWTFETWDTPSKDAFVENSTLNGRTVYFDVILDATDELVYSSPYIPIGAELPEFALDTEVPAGEYTASMVYHLVDDDYNETSKLTLAVKLVIEG